MPFHDRYQIIGSLGVLPTVLLLLLATVSPYICGGAFRGALPDAEAVRCPFRWVTYFRVVSVSAAAVLLFMWVNDAVGTKGEIVRDVFGSGSWLKDMLRPYNLLVLSLDCLAKMMITNLAMCDFVLHILADMLRKGARVKAAQIDDQKRFLALVGGVFGHAPDAALGKEWCEKRDWVSGKPFFESTETGKKQWQRQ